MIYKYKGYDIKPHGVFSTSYIVVVSGRGGKIPNVLSGMFTSVGVAKDSIDFYLLNKGSANNGKTISESGDQ